MASVNGHRRLRTRFTTVLVAGAARKISTTVESSVARLAAARFGRLVPKAATFEAHVAAVRALRYADRTTALRVEPHEPGVRILRLEPDAIPRLAQRLSGGSAMICATNGKTTTVAMTASIIRRSGGVPVYSRAGLNMSSGVAGELVASARLGGRMRGTTGVFEIDELALPPLVDQIHPRVLMLGNLFRDQLDRYGEIDSIARVWAEVLAPRAGWLRLVACADDPLIADLTRHRPGTLFYGLGDDSMAHAGGLEHASDSGYCRRCGIAYQYESVYLAHLGAYSCSSCGYRRPVLGVSAETVVLEGLTGSRFTLRIGGQASTVSLPVPGLFNVYNALGAASVATRLGISFTDIVGGLETTPAAFGRGEVIGVGDVAIRILLTKNPAGANAVIGALVAAGAELDLLFGLNDRPQDGRDVSWVWDADFERLAGLVRRATCYGERSSEMALRLKYAGVDESRIAILSTIGGALDQALESGRDVCALTNYTAMLGLRETLSDRGLAPRYWR
jgi:lipid II isoglutaminyl synthase (glutamine-hydrolysing)